MAKRERQFGAPVVIAHREFKAPAPRFVRGCSPAFILLIFDASISQAAKSLILMARPTGLEPVFPPLKGDVLDR